MAAGYIERFQMMACIAPTHFRPVETGCLLWALFRRIFFKLCPARAWALLDVPRAQIRRNRPDRLFFSGNPLACQCARRGI